VQPRLPKTSNPPVGKSYSTLTEPHRPADGWGPPVLLENGRSIAELELKGVVVASDQGEKQPMPLTPEWSTDIQARLELLLEEYKSGDFVAVIRDGEAVESSLPLEDWEDINFVYLKLLIYCAYQKRSAADDSAVTAEARRRKEEMLDHGSNPECDPLSFTKGGY
jgi:hypothetical protein